MSTRAAAERPLLDAIVELANHWRYPSGGDFRYSLPELAQTLRELVVATTGVDAFDGSIWDPKGPKRQTRHEVVFQQVISDANTQAVCACGHVFDSFASTVATRFGKHLQQVAEVHP